MNNLEALEAIAKAIKTSSELATDNAEFETKVKEQEYELKCKRLVILDLQSMTSDLEKQNERQTGRIKLFEAITSKFVINYHGRKPNDFYLTSTFLPTIPNEEGKAIISNVTKEIKSLNNAGIKDGE